MQKFSSIVLALLITIFSGVLFIYGCNQNPQQEERKQFAKINEGEQVPELAEYMQHIQQYTHKLSLSVKAQNGELADFYMHELRAKLLGVKQDIPGYEGYNIAYFMGFMLDPVVDSLAASLKTRNWDKITANIEGMIQSCNTCHNATGHGFVHVTAGFDKNPYNQVFEPER